MAVTQAELIVGAKTAANMQVDGPLSTTEWQALSNRALEALYVDATAINQTLRVSTATLTITSASTPYAALPADFSNALRVFKDAGTSQQIEIFRSGTESSEHPRSFRLEGSNLYIDPFQDAPGSYQLRYTPTPTALSGVADLDAELAQHREYLELHMAIAALSSEQSSTSDLMPRFKVCKDRLESWAARQRSSQPTKVRDVRPNRFIRGY